MSLLRVLGIDGVYLYDGYCFFTGGGGTAGKRDQLVGTAAALHASYDVSTLSVH